jgi:hypothetical protein
MTVGTVVVEQPLTPGDVVRDREIFLSDLVAHYEKVGQGLMVVDIARTCWDAGHVRATLCGRKSE